MIVVTMPMSGALFYLLWGSHGIKPKKAEDFLRIEHRVSKIMRQDEAVTRAFGSQYPEYRPHMNIWRATPPPPLYQSTQVEYYPFGQDFFPPLSEKLKAARHYIFMDTLLCRTARCGAARWKFCAKRQKRAWMCACCTTGSAACSPCPPIMQKPCAPQGIQCFAVSPFRFSWHPSDYKLLNHRDHRKITVIDGEVGFTGGMNFADEYINRKKSALACE